VLLRQLGERLQVGVVAQPGRDQMRVIGHEAVRDQFKVLFP
jgi:hypothetical protein